MRPGKPLPFLRAFLPFPCSFGPALFCPCGTRLTNLIPQKTIAPDLLPAPDTNASFTLHEDDGVSNDWQHGAYLKTKKSTCKPESRPKFALSIPGMMKPRLKASIWTWCAAKNRPSMCC